MRTRGPTCIHGGWQRPVYATSAAVNYLGISSAITGDAPITNGAAGSDTACRS